MYNKTSISNDPSRGTLPRSPVGKHARARARCVNIVHISSGKSPVLARVRYTHLVHIHRALALICECVPTSYTALCVCLVHKDAARADLRGAGHAGRAAPRRREQTGQAVVLDDRGYRQRWQRRGRSRRPECPASGHR